MPAPNARLDEIARLQHGDLAETPYAVLLYALARSRRTVTVEIRRGPLRKEISFETGVPIDCRSNLVHETLGRFMVSTGRLDEETADNAFRESVARSLRFGDILIEKGLVTAEELFKILQQNLAHKLLDGFSWRDGSFRLTAAPAVPDSALKVNVPQLILIGVGRFATQEQIDGSIGPLIGKALAINPLPTFEVDDIKLPPGLRPLIEALEPGPKRIDELAAATGIEYRELTRSLYALHLIELVVPADHVPRDTPEKDERPHEAAAETPARTASEQAPTEIPQRLRSELMELALNHRRIDPLELLGVDPDHVTTTAHRCFLAFAEKFAPWRYGEDLADPAREVFLAGARAYAHLCDPDRRKALIASRARRSEPPQKAPSSEPFRVATDLLDSEKQFAEGVKLAAAGDLARAATQLEFAADLDPQNARYRAELAYCRYRLDPEGSTKEAVEALNEAIRIDPHCGLALYYTGEILRHSGKFDEAEVFLKRSLKPMAPDRRPVDALRALSQDRKASL